jgi:hypothetical protein
MNKLKCLLFLLFLSTQIFSKVNFSEDNKSLGMFLGVSVEGVRISEKQLIDLEQQTGFKSNFINFFLHWPKKENEGFFPNLSLESIWDYGAVPVITWEPIYLDQGKSNIISYDMILSGKYDEYLSLVADQIKLFKKPIIIRFAHEMNLSSYHWGVEPDKYNEKYPFIYKSLYEYVFTFFKRRKIKNILWAFCPNSESVPNVYWNTLKSYYLGDKYTDILGLDGYNWGNNSKTKTSWKSFENIFSFSYNKIKEVDSKKPLFIFETATVDKGGNKTKWISDALKKSKELDIVALIWFQIDKEKNWKITEKEKEIFKKNNFKQRQFPQQWIERLVK